MTPVERVLLDRWTAHGDADAFAQIVAGHSAMVYNTCLRLLKSSAEAEDVAQECFCLLASGKARVRSSVGSWLHALATHRSLDRLRAGKRRREREHRFVEQSTQSVAPGWDDVQEYVDEGISQLPPKLRDPLIAHFLENQPYEVIAETLGLPRSTVASRVQKAVQCVRRELRKRGVPVSESVLAGAFVPVTHTVPPALAGALGKMAVAGPGGQSLTTTGLVALHGGIVLMAKKVTIGIAAAAIIASMAYLLSTQVQGKTGGRKPGIALTREAVQEAGSAPERAGTAPLGSPATDPTPASASGQQPDSPGSQTAPAPSAAGDGQGPVQEAAGDGQGPAQETDLSPASVSGYVMDEKGYVFPDASIRVEVAKDENGFNGIGVFETETDNAGVYALAIRSFGYATVFASAKGCIMQKRSCLLLAPGAALDDVDFVLVRGQFFVAGEVVDQDGKPIAKAGVHLRRYGNSDTGSSSDNVMPNFAYAVSEEDGHFEIAVEREGSCDFTVIKEGYGAGFFPNISTGTDDARFVLRAAGAISGRVALPDGSPVPGARIEVVGQAYALGTAPSDGGQPMSLTPVQASTDSDGKYLATDLGSDYYYLVQLKQAANENAGGISGLAPKIFRFAEAVFGAADLGQYREVRVTPGETTTDVDFVIASLARVYGRVTDRTTGAPAYHVVLRAYLERSQESDSAAWTWTESDGSYNLKVPMSTGTSVSILGLYTHSLGHAWPAGDGPLAVINLSPGDERQQDLLVDGPVTVPVRVTDGAGAPQAGVTLMLRDAATGSASGTNETTDAEGCFTIYGVAPNRSFAVLAVDANLRETMTILGQSEPFSGAPGEILPQVIVVVASQGGVEGTIVDAQGKPLPNMAITVTVVGDQNEVSAEALTDEEGRFTLLRAFTDGHYSELRITSHARGFVERGTVVNVALVRDSVVDMGVVTLVPVGQNPDAGSTPK